MTLEAVPCQCVWLEIANKDEKTLIAICKRCKRKGTFTLMEWEALLYEGVAINKPIRI